MAAADHDLDQPAAAAPSAARSADGSPQPLYLGLTLETWVKIGVVAGLFAALFWPNLRRLWGKTNPFYGEPNWGHAICIPLIGLYYLYTNRDQLLKQVVKPAWTGLPVALFGILFYAYWIWPGQNDMFKDVGMVVTLFGVVLLLAGWAVMKVTWFPIAYLLCGIPWPGLVYSWVAGPLQHLAARAAVFTLKLTGVQAHNSGTKIDMLGEGGQWRTLNVAEACAGLRSLMTFITVAAAVAFLSARPLWQKLIITASAVPIAIFCNTMRVAGQGLLDYYVSHELSESFAHQFVGIVMLVPAFFLILLVGWLLDQIFIEEADEATVAAATRQQRAGAVTGVTPPPAATRAKAQLKPVATVAVEGVSTSAVDKPLVIDIPRRALTPKRPPPPGAPGSAASRNGGGA